VSSLTPFQTVGPYLSLGLHAGIAPIAIDQAAHPITIHGRLIDGGGQGIPDGVLEWWHPALPTLQRSLTAVDGGFAIQTLKPPKRSNEAPHLAVRVLGRGILTQYLTRLYFSDESGNAADPILALVPEHRRRTLIAQRSAVNVYQFDVVIQGDNETVFFDI
jgi:protocatechuate 3,4-dioxygenase alpha subunit